LYPIAITLDQTIQTHMQDTPAKKIQKKQIGDIDTPSQQAVKYNEESGNRNDTNHYHPHTRTGTQ